MLHHRISSTSVPIAMNATLNCLWFATNCNLAYPLWSTLLRHSWYKDLESAVNRRAWSKYQCRYIFQEIDDRAIQFQRIIISKCLFVRDWIRRVDALSLLTYLLTYNCCFLNCLNLVNIVYDFGKMQCSLQVDGQISFELNCKITFVNFHEHLIACMGVKKINNVDILFCSLQSCGYPCDSL